MVIAQPGIEGFVVNHHLTPITQANISIVNQKDSNTLVLKTNELGFFEQNLKAGNYQIKISSIGFTSFLKSDIVVDDQTVDMGSLMLSTSDNILELVTITNQKKLVERKADRIIINIENSILSEGMSAVEILQRAPGVKISEDGGISVRGKSDVGILINGKLSYLSPKELINLLRSTSSSAIKSVELITNPSAKYDAKGLGGMINIVMKTGNRSGFNGTINGFGGMGRGARYGGGIQFNADHKKMSLIMNFDQNYRVEKEFRHFNRYFDHVENENLSRISNQYSKTYEPLTIHNVKFGLEYQLYPTFSIGGIWTGNFGAYNSHSTGYNNILNNDQEMITNTLTDNNNQSRWDTNSFNLNFLKQFGDKGNLAGDFDYLHADYHAMQALVSDFQATVHQTEYLSKRKINTPSVTKLYIGKLDYSLSINVQQKLEMGWKSSRMNADNHSINDTLKSEQWVADETTSNHFIYHEDIHAAYANYHYEGEKWNLTAGARLENTRSRGNQDIVQQSKIRNDTRLFPSAAVGYHIDSNNQILLSYSRRINRPDYEDLNPFRYYMDAFVFFEGNPNLQSELAHAFELNYTLSNGFHASLFYTDVKNVITSTLTQIPNHNITIRSQQNIKGFLNKGINLNYTILPLSFWSSTNNVTIFNNHYFGTFNQEVIDNSQWSSSFLSSNTIKLPKKWSLEVNAAFNSAQTDGVFRERSYANISAGLMKRLLSNNLSVKLSVNDIFKTMRYKTESIVSNVIMNQSFNLDERALLLSITYKFGARNSENLRLSRENKDQQRVRGGKN